MLRVCQPCQQAVCNSAASAAAYLPAQLQRVLCISLALSYSLGYIAQLSNVA